MAEAPRLEEAIEFAENSKRYLPQRHRERTPWRSSVRARRATLGPASGRSCAHAARESGPCGRAEPGDTAATPWPLGAGQAPWTGYGRRNVSREGGLQRNG